MERSEPQKEILELGKLLVKELNLTKSVDTLSRWMAHYVAEKIKYIEDLPKGLQKKKEEKECFSMILDLWKHRWNYKPDRQPLRDFNPLFDILQKLNPDSRQPYFYTFFNEKSVDDSSSQENYSEIKNFAPLAQQIDKVARIWIEDLLHEAVKKVKNKKVKKIIKHAVKMPDSVDAQIIEIVLQIPGEHSDDQHGDQSESARKNKIKTLTTRLMDLKKFARFNEQLTEKLEKEINKLSKTDR